MWFYEVAPTKIVRRAVSTLTYHSASQLSVGQLVTIPVGSSVLNGVIMATTTQQPSYETKAIISVIEPTPLPEALIQVALWMTDYYHTPLASVLQTLLPRGLTVKRRDVTIASQQPSIRNRATIVFNKEQTDAVTKIDSVSSGTILLQGVTGSGKTEVYKEVIRRTIANGKSAIVLVPEIGLTSQIVDEFMQEFDHVIVTHSDISDAKRHILWKSALYSKEPTIVIGPRSALFMPLHNVGVIIVDESHEPSYKQEQSPRYSALRVASVLGRHWEAKVIFGSATPAVIDRFVAEKRQANIVTLNQVARDNARAPDITLIDMKQREQFKRHRFFSDILLNQIETNLSLGKQTLIFHNRRGSASSTLCQQCGWTANCPRCFVPLILHSDTFELRCHICNHKESVPTACPVCQRPDIIHKGIGTKLIEHELQRLFPNASIARFDSDSDKVNTLNERYAQLYQGAIDIVIGTQGITKGLDLPHLRTVGVVQADAGLSLPDFAASERAFQLLAQVIGRVGRDNRETNVIVQSYQPTHPVIQFGITQHYNDFYHYALQERKRAGFPPYRYLLLLTNVYKTEASAIKQATMLAKELRHNLLSDVEILGPTPAFHERQQTTYRWQLLLKSRKRQPLIRALDYLPPAHWQFELDPSSLL